MLPLGAPITSAQIGNPTNDEGGNDDTLCQSVDDQYYIFPASCGRANKKDEGRDNSRGGAVSADDSAAGERKGEGATTSGEYGAGFGSSEVDGPGVWGDKNRMRRAMRKR